MVDYSSVSIPRPLDWQAFERCCRVLFECLLNDSQTNLHGRSGQPQHGVDVFGCRDGDSTRRVGVQCKGKEGDYLGNVTRDELEREVAKARGFTPVLSEFFLVTTAPNDAKLQKRAREITSENARHGRPLSVTVWGWNDLQARIAEHPRAMQAFHPDLTPFSTELQINIREIQVASEQRGAESQEIIAKLNLLLRQGGPASRSAADATVSAAEVLDPHLHREIDGYRDLLNQGRPRTARQLLESLRDRVWEMASSRVRFRILTNIGAAKLRLGDETEAAADFLAAVLLDPTDRVGMANVSLAYLLRGEKAAAGEAAERALAADPANAAAAAYLIQAHWSGPQLGEPLDLVPERVRHDPPVLLATIAVLNRHGLPAWRALARTAAASYPDDLDLQHAAGRAELEALLEAPGFLAGEPPPASFETDRLARAAAMLRNVWDALRESEVKIADTSLPFNLAQAYRLLDQLDQAAVVLDEARPLFPAEPELCRLRASIHALQDEEAKALEVLAVVPNDPEARLMRAELLHQTDPKQTIALLEPGHMAAMNAEDRQHASALYVEAWLADGNPEAALEAARALISEHPGSIQALRTLSRAQRKADPAAADDSLRAAMAQIQEDTPFRERFLLAQELAATDRPEAVAALLVGRVDSSRDTPALRKLISALINSDQRRMALDVIRSIPAALAGKPYFLRAAAAIYLNQRNLPEAKRAIEQYLVLRPNDLELRLRWIDLHIRLGKTTSVQRFLDGNLDALAGDAEEVMQLAKLLNHFGHRDRALALAYQTLLRHFGNAQCHLLFTGIFFHPRHAERTDLRRTHIGRDAAFITKNARGETETFVIEADAALRLRDECIPPDHTFARAADGLTLGETFVVGDEIDPRNRWTVQEIKHKFVHLLHIVLARYERRFPSIGGLESLAIDEASDEPFDPVLRRVRERHDAVAEAFQEYETLQLPLRLIAQAFNSDIVEVRGGLAESGRPFRICLGTEPERLAAFEAIRLNARRGCLVDTITLHTIRRLGVEEVVRSVCGPIAVTQTTIDDFESRRHELDAHRGHPFMTIAFRSGTYYRDEISAEKIEAAFDMVEGDLSWLREQCRIVPAVGKGELPDQLRSLHTKLGRHFFDDMLGADGEDLLLLSDDYTYRSLAIGELGLRGAWLQPLLMIAIRRGLLTQDGYMQRVIQLIEAGCRFISIDGSVLYAAATADSSEALSQPFMRVSGTLGGTNADLLSHIRVAAACLRALWGTPEASIRRLAQTSRLLEVLCQGNSSNWPSIVNAFRQLVQSSSGGLEEHMLQWLKGHFLVPFETPTLLAALASANTKGPTGNHRRKKHGYFSI